MVKAGCPRVKRVMNYDITVKMCPKCKSTNIYKRIRQDGLSYLNKGKRIVGIINKYSCRACKNEFDVPLVGPKNVKILKKGDDVHG